MSEWDEFLVEDSPSREWDEFIIKDDSHFAPSQKDEIGTLITKSLLSGALTFADLPFVLAGLGELGVLKLGSLTTGKEMPESQLLQNLPSNYLKQGIEAATGWNPEPQPATGGERVLSGGLQGLTGILTGGGLAGAGAKGLAKTGALGAGIGGSGVALEEMGVDPLTANLVPALAAPAIGGLAKTPINFMNRFKKENKLANTLRHEIGEQNIPQVLKNLQDKLPLDIEATSAELAQNPAISNLHRTYAPNSQILAAQEAANSGKLDEALRKLAPEELNSKEIGRILQDKLQGNLDTLKGQRRAATEPLYEKLKTSYDRIPIDNLHNFMAAEHELGGASADYVRKIHRWLADTKSGIKHSGDSSYLPAKLDRIKKDISGELGKAVRAGNDAEAFFWQSAKDAIESDIKSHPLGLEHSKLYAEKSKPISAIKEHKVLSPAIKKDRFKQGFELAHEEVPKKLINKSLSSEQYTKDLLAQFKDDPAALDAIKSHIRKDIFGKSKNQSMYGLDEKFFSFPKVEKVLSENKGGLQQVFGNDYKTLEDIRDVLARRNYRNTANSSIGSPTASRLELMGKVGDSLLSKGARRIPVVGDWLLEGIKTADKNAYTNLMEKALSNPDYLSEILQHKASPVIPSLWSNVAASQGARSGASAYEKKRRKLTDEEINKKVQESFSTTDEDRRNRKKLPTLSFLPKVDIPIVDRR